MSGWIATVALLVLSVACAPAGGQDDAASLAFSAAEVRALADQAAASLEATAGRRRTCSSA